MNKWLGAFSFSLAVFQFGLIASDDTTIHKHYIYLGGDAGFSTLNSGVTTEIDKDGYHLDVKGLYSYSWNKITLDAGFGYLYNRIESTTTSLPLIREAVSTRAIFFEFSPRYRFGSHIEIGPVAQAVLGTDVGFGAAGGANHFVMLAGAEALYKFNFTFPLRLVASILTDLNISDRTFLIYMGGIQIGFPIPEIKLPERSPRVEVLPEKRVRIVLDSGLIYFDFNSSTLSAPSKLFLEKLGAYLQSVAKDWQTLVVEGHTDSRGSHAYNLKLSQRRADSVKTVLASKLKASGRVSGQGYSFDRPKVKEDSDEARGKNRRVEFVFEGVEDPEDLQNSIAKIYQEVFP